MKEVERLVKSNWHKFGWKYICDVEQFLVSLCCLQILIRIISIIVCFWAFSLIVWSIVRNLTRLFSAGFELVQLKMWPVWVKHCNALLPIYAICLRCYDAQCQHERSTCCFGCEKFMWIYSELPIWCVPFYAHELPRDMIFVIKCRGGTRCVKYLFYHPCLVSLFSCFLDLWSDCFNGV